MAGILSIARWETTGLDPAPGMALEGSWTVPDKSAWLPFVFLLADFVLGFAHP
jgi:hypothetical protein